MVWTKSTAARQRFAANGYSNASAACNNGHSERDAESVRFGSTSLGDAAGANAAARISESRAESGPSDH
jgi:hypothetical protein